MENTAVVIDSAPREAMATITAAGLAAETTTTRDTVNLRTGNDFKIHFVLKGYKDADRDLKVSQKNSFVCVELQPLIASTPKGKCPSK